MVLARRGGFNWLQSKKIQRLCAKLHGKKRHFKWLYFWETALPNVLFNMKTKAHVEKKLDVIYKKDSSDLLGPVPVKLCLMLPM